MEKFFKVILNDEEQAFKASQEIVNLAEQGEIKVNELFIITRKENGEIKILDVKSGKVPYTTSGSMIGGLLGILGGTYRCFIWDDDRDDGWWYRRFNQNV